MAVAPSAQTAARRRPKYRKLAWFALFLLAAAMTAMIVIPVFLIMPFKTQTPRAIDTAYNLKRWSPLVTIFGFAVTLGLTVYLWRGGRWFKRTVMILLIALAGLWVWFARQNHFEWMFNPLPAAAYAPASDAAFVNDSDQVMAITVNNESVAYPVRAMAYHHVIGDTVGGVPIVATY
jgi:hypothetical protein